MTTYFLNLFYLDLAMVFLVMAAFLGQLFFKYFLSAHEVEILGDFSDIILAATGYTHPTLMVYRWVLVLYKLTQKGLF